MDQNTVSKEALAEAIREAIRHVNRNLYEWTQGCKSNDTSKVKLTLSHTEMVGLTRNWMVRSLRKLVGNRDADMLFRGVVVIVDSSNLYVSAIYISTSGEYCKMYNTVGEILRSITYKNLQYKSSDYLSEGMSGKKPSFFDPSLFISHAGIDAIKF